MIMEETFKNKFTLVEKDLIKAGPKPIVSEARKKIVKVEFMFLFIQKNYHKCVLL